MRYHLNIYIILYIYNLVSCMYIKLQDLTGMYVQSLSLKDSIPVMKGTNIGLNVYNINDVYVAIQMKVQLQLVNPLPHESLIIPRIINIPQET